jgi:hypothetical protein
MSSAPELRKIHTEFDRRFRRPFADASLSDYRRRITHAEEQTAWASREAKYAGVIVGIDADPANAEKLPNGARIIGSSTSFSSGGAYLNFIQDEGQDRIKATYKENYERLTKVKRKYDPENFFRVNQNILPGDKD